MKRRFGRIAIGAAESGASYASAQAIKCALAYLAAHGLPRATIRHFARYAC